MRYKDSDSNIVYDIPGAFDWEILLDPAELRFMVNADGASVPESEGYTVYRDKKRGFGKKKASVLGVWYTEKDPTTPKSLMHQLRLLPAVRHSYLIPTDDTRATVYPIPLYQNGSAVATLVLFASRNIIFTTVHGLIASDDLPVLLEQFLTEVRSKDPSVEALQWFQDTRNSTYVAFPAATETYDSDILAQILRLADPSEHILTADEHHQKILRRKKLLQAAAVSALFIVGLSWVGGYIKRTEQHKLLELESRDQTLQRTLLIKKSQEARLQVLTVALHRQPDYALTLLRLYAGTFGLTKRHIHMALSVNSGAPKLVYSIQGLSFVRLQDMRPELKKDLQVNGFTPETFTLVPLPNMDPAINIQGVAQLSVTK